MRLVETPARYISIMASSTEVSRRLYRSMIAVANLMPLSLGILRVTWPEVVVSSALVVAGAVGLAPCRPLVAVGSVGLASCRPIVAVGAYQAVGLLREGRSGCPRLFF